MGSWRKRERSRVPDWKNICSLKPHQGRRGNRNRIGQILKDDRVSGIVQLNRGRGNDRGRGRCWGKNRAIERKIRKYRNVVLNKALKEPISKECTCGKQRKG